MSDRERRRILYMEDDEGAAGLFRKSLEYAGWDVDIAHDGRPGLEMLESGAYDLAAVDYSMPGVNGRDVCV